MQRRLLVVDDEPSIVKGLKFSLEQDGYLVDSAFDGKEALEKLEITKYDLVILDVMLPEVDGLEVLRRIREK
jgi:DNA-binding response OmpR family regulator